MDSCERRAAITITGQADQGNGRTGQEVLRRPQTETVVFPAEHEAASVVIEDSSIAPTTNPTPAELELERLHARRSEAIRKGWDTRRRIIDLALPYLRDGVVTRDIVALGLRLSPDRPTLTAVQVNSMRGRARRRGLLPSPTPEELKEFRSRARKGLPSPQRGRSYAPELLERMKRIRRNPEFMIRVREGRRKTKLPEDELEQVKLLGVAKQVPIDRGMSTFVEFYQRYFGYRPTSSRGRDLREMIYAAIICENEYKDGGRPRGDQDHSAIRLSDVKDCYDRFRPGTFDKQQCNIQLLRDKIAQAQAQAKTSEVMEVICQRGFGASPDEEQSERYGQTLLAAVTAERAHLGRELTGLDLRRLELVATAEEIIRVCGKPSLPAVFERSKALLPKDRDCQQLLTIWYAIGIASQLRRPDQDRKHIPNLTRLQVAEIFEEYRPGLVDTLDLEWMVVEKNGLSSDRRRPTDDVR